MENPASSNKPRKILVTGAAGFIGSHLCNQLVTEGFSVIGLDNLCPTVDSNLKADRLRNLGFEPETIEGIGKQESATIPKLSFIHADILDRDILADILSEQFNAVVHLAALVGVRNSILNPRAYLDVNVNGFLNVMEAAGNAGLKHFIYASSSSVYGANREIPFATTHKVDQPVSYYAVSKKTNELLAHTYAHLNEMPVTGLRFFTVYGPWGRQDMAAALFTRNILENKPITVFNNGKLRRDFTFVGDIVEGIGRIVKGSPAPLSEPYRLYNIGLGKPVPIMDFIQIIEELTGKKAIVEFAEHQAGDLPETYADISGLKRDFGYAPETGLREGLTAYIDWFRAYYGF